MFNFFKSSPSGKNSQNLSVLPSASSSVSSSVSAPPSLDTAKSKSQRIGVSTSKDDSSDDESISTDVAASLFDVVVEQGSGKGFPPDVCFVLYHTSQSLICAGTKSGSVYVYGDGFQYMRPWLSEQTNELIRMVNVGEDKLLVAFNDNSLALFRLPSLEVIDIVIGELGSNFLVSSWLQEADGNITFMHVDENSTDRSSMFVYVGTSAGNVYILEITPTIRISEYMIASSEITSISISITELHICPKDERYLAIAYSRSEDDAGGDCSDGNGKGILVIFDLKKKKPYKQVTTKETITSISWDYLGDTLYAGTLAGELHMLSLDRSIFTTVWNCNSDNSYTRTLVGIRQLVWMPPQNKISTTGCLFMLLGSDGDDDGDFLPHAIIGLAPNISNKISSLTDSSDTMTSIIEIPPIAGEEIVGFRLAPTIDRSNNAIMVPAFLMLSRVTDKSNHRYLRILRCPSSPLTDWSLETGLLPEPKLVDDVLATIGNTTCIAAIPPVLSSNTHTRTISSILSTAAFVDRISNRSFYESVYPQDQSDSSWDLLLSNGCLVADTNRLQDTVFLGTTDGSVVIYGVFLPQKGIGIGRGNAWIPLKHMQCSDEEIQLIENDVEGEYIVVGDVSGRLQVREIYDTASNLGATDIHKEIKRMHSDNDHGYCKSDMYSPNDLRIVLDVVLPSKVTKTVIMNELSTIVMGTADGSIFISVGMSRTSMESIPLGLPGSMLGAVMNMTYTYFEYLNTTIPALYVLFQSSHLIIIDMVTLEVVAMSVGPQDLFKMDGSSSSSKSCKTAACVCVVSKSNKTLSRPNELYDITPTRRNLILKPAALSNSRSMTKQVAISSEQPCYVHVIVDKAVITYNLSYFVMIMPDLSISGGYNSNAYKFKFISTRDMVAGTTVSYTDVSGTKQVDCISCIDTDATVFTMNIRTLQPLYHADTLETVLDKPIKIHGGAILSNGSSYIHVNGHFVCSASISNNDKAYSLAATPVPSRGWISSDSIDTASLRMLQLQPTSVRSITASQAKTSSNSTKPGFSIFRKSATSSSLPVTTAATTTATTTAPSELSKLFGRTRLQMSKVDLIGDDYSDDYDEVGGAKGVNSKLQNQMADMNELRDALQERGERLKQISDRMDNFKASAAEFKDITHRANRSLKEKDRRWGM